MDLLYFAVTFSVCFVLTYSMTVNEEKQLEVLSTDVSYNTQPGMSWLREITSSHAQPHSRKKRFIRFPIGTNFEMKWSINLPFETFTDYKAKFQIALPIKMPFPDYIFPLAKSRSDDEEYPLIDEEYPSSNQYDYSQYEQQFYHQDSDPAWISRRKRAARQERRSIYNHLEGALEKTGSDGRQCVLRAICDIGEAPLELGIFGEMLNTILTASSAGRPDDPSEDADYDTFIEAELHGKLNGDCAHRYKKCKVSPFDLVPHIIQTYT